MKPNPFVVVGALAALVYVVRNKAAAAPLPGLPAGGSAPVLVAGTSPYAPGVTQPTQALPFTFGAPL